MTLRSLVLQQLEQLYCKKSKRSRKLIIRTPTLPERNSVGVMRVGKSVRNSLRRRQYLRRVVIGQVPDVSFEQTEFTWLSHVSPLSRYVPRHINEHILNITQSLHDTTSTLSLSSGESARAARIPQPLDSQTPRRPTGPRKHPKTVNDSAGRLHWKRKSKKESQRKREREGAGPEIEMDVSVVGPGIHALG